MGGAPVAVAFHPPRVLKLVELAVLLVPEPVADAEVPAVLHGLREGGQHPLPVVVEDLATAQIRVADQLRGRKPEKSLTLRRQDVGRELGRCCPIERPRAAVDQTMECQIPPGPQHLGGAARHEGFEQGGDLMRVRQGLVVEHPDLTEHAACVVQQGESHVALHSALCDPGIVRKALRQAVCVQARCPPLQAFAGGALGVVALTTTERRHPPPAGHWAQPLAVRIQGLDHEGDGHPKHIGPVLHQRLIKFGARL